MRTPVDHITKDIFCCSTALLEHARDYRPALGSGRAIRAVESAMALYAVAFPRISPTMSMEWCETYSPVQGLPGRQVMGDIQHELRRQQNEGLAELIALGVPATTPERVRMYREGCRLWVYGSPGAQALGLALLVVAGVATRVYGDTFVTGDQRRQIESAFAEAAELDTGTLRDEIDYLASVIEHCACTRAMAA